MNKDKIQFHQRHIGPDEKEISEMLKAVGAQSIEELIDKSIPEDISIDNPIEIRPMDELEYAEHIRKSFKETSLKILPGTPRIPLTRRKFPRDVLKPF